MKKIDNIIVDNKLPFILHNYEDLDICIVGASTAAELQNQPDFICAPITNNVEQGKLYEFGTYAGYTIYVDPYLAWEDSSITLVKDIEEYERF